MIDSRQIFHEYVLRNIVSARNCVKMNRNEERSSSSYGPIGVYHLKYMHLSLTAVYDKCKGSTFNMSLP
jgi:hypothetical protein